MTDKRLCTALTRRGAPCRSAARPGTEPPRCGRHLTTGSQARSTQPFYRIALTTDEVADLERAGATSAADEVLLVRVVLRRLLQRLNDPTYTVLPEDLRGLAGLIFAGARTVMQLLAQQAAGRSDLDDWLNQALDVVAAELSTEL
jgi:hypothetical protein